MSLRGELGRFFMGERFEAIAQALRLIARIPLIQWREKHRSREEKSTFTQWFSAVYVRSLKDQARQSKYPRT